MVRLLLARHGETTWNAEGRYQGTSDVPLSSRGEAQAQALACRLAREGFDVVYASDLQRAWQTAEAIAARHGLEVCPEPRLREIAFGDWEGLTYDEIQQRYPDAVAAWGGDPVTVRPPGGESLAEVAARVRGVLADIASRHKGGSVLLVAHGGTLRILLCDALGIGPGLGWQFRLDPASLSEVCLYDEGAIVGLLNDTNHLELGPDEAVL